MGTSKYIRLWLILCEKPNYIGHSENVSSIYKLRYAFKIFQFLI